MSEQQEGASGRKVIVDEVRRDPHSTRIESIYSRVEHVMDPKFDGIPVVIARNDTMESIHKLRAEALAEQVEKLKVRRDSWRERYEQAQVDLEEHRKGREVLAELLAHNPVALELQRERDDLSDALRKARVAQTRAELSRDWWSLAAAMGFGYIVVDLARAVLS